MRKQTRNRLLTATLALSLLSVGAGFGALNTAKAEEAAMPVTDTFAPWGAQVRTQDPSGIRFLTCVNTEWMESMLEKGAQFGTILAPASHYTGDLVHFAHPTDEDEFVVEDVKHTEEANWETVGDYTVLRAVLTGMPQEFYGTDILAKTYLYADLTDDGVENPTYTYAAGQSRSIAEVACIAIQNGENAKFLTDTFESTVQGVSVSDTEMNLYVNYFGNVTAKPVFAEGLVSMPDAKDFPVVWTSSNQSVATVDENGKVVGVSAGTATLTATLGTYSKTVTVKVSEGTETGTSFEYGISSDFIQNNGVSFALTDNGVTNGEKALAYTVSKSGGTWFEIKNTFFDAMFADSTVTAVQFDYFNGGLSEHSPRPKNTYTEKVYGNTGKTITLTRAMYKALKGDTLMSWVFNDPSSETNYTLYLDNFRTTTKAIDTVDGSLDNINSTYRANKAVNYDKTRVCEGEASYMFTVALSTGSNSGVAIKTTAWNNLMTSDAYAVSFDVWAPKAYEYQLVFGSQTQAKYPECFGTLTANAWTTLTITKATYDAIKAEFKYYAGSTGFDFVFKGAGIANGDKYFIDNFRTVPVDQYEGAVSNFSNGYGGSLVAVNTDTAFIKDGNASIKNTVTDASRGAGFGFTKTAFNYSFTRDDVKEISFEVYVTSDCAFKIFNSSTTLTTAEFENARTVSLKGGEWTKITISKEMYDEAYDLIYKNSAGTAFDFKLTDVAVGDVLYLDNIQIVKTGNTGDS